MKQTFTISEAREQAKRLFDASHVTEKEYQDHLRWLDSLPSWETITITEIS